MMEPFSSLKLDISIRWGCLRISFSYAFFCICSPILFLPISVFLKVGGKLADLISVHLEN